MTCYTSMAYKIFMTRTSRLVTVVELHEFARVATKLWSEDELTAFIDYIAAHPLAGVVI